MGLHTWLSPHGPQAANWPIGFALDEETEREAEDAARAYVTFGPWSNGYVGPQGNMLPPSGTGPLGAGFGGAGPGPIPGMGGETDAAKVGTSPVPVVPSPYGADPTGGWGHIQIVQNDFRWAGPPTGVAGGTGPMFGNVPGAGLAGVPGVPMGGLAPATPPNMVLAQQPVPSIPPAAAPLAATPHIQPTPVVVPEQPPATPAPAAVEEEAVGESVGSPPAESVKDATPPSQVIAGAMAETGTGLSSSGGESLPPILPDITVPETDVASTAAPSPTTSATPRATGGVASPSAAASPSGGNSWKTSDFINPNRTWANIVTKDLETANTSGRQASSSSGAPAGRREEDVRSRKDSIIDYLLLLARSLAGSVDGQVNGHSTELPEELRKFKQVSESGVLANARAKYNRRGMKNDANNCYVNVVIQSLLPCSALMQILSHCTPDGDRPFYSGMHRLCKEFHSKKLDSHAEALNVLGLPQVKKIISTWQLIGAQQDAGEFLFHVLNGLHDECKWKIEESSLTTLSKDVATDTREEADGEAVRSVKEGEVRPDVRAAGDHEDSPIFRIFGGIIRSSVQLRNAKGDSISLEPFNGLILDISSPSVDSVWSALEAYCGKEDVHEGKATKRLQFKAVPKVLILNLKRFSYNKDTGCPQKIRKAVKFEEKLTFDRAWLVDDLEPSEYHLTAVICHHGDLVSGGHYNAAVRYNTEWYMYDDAVVRQIDIREVVNQLAVHAYLLLYQCHDRVDIRPC